MKEKVSQFNIFCTTLSFLKPATQQYHQCLYISAYFLKQVFFVFIEPESGLIYFLTFIIFNVKTFNDRRQI